MWNVLTRHLTATRTGPGFEAVEAVAYSPRGKTLATGDYDGSAYLWEPGRQPHRP